MIVHIGADLKGGHYITYIKIRDNWFEMNDDHLGINKLAWTKLYTY